MWGAVRRAAPPSPAPRRAAPPSPADRPARIAVKGVRAGPRWGACRLDRVLRGQHDEDPLSGRNLHPSMPVVYAASAKPGAGCHAGAGAVAVAAPAKEARAKEARAEEARAAARLAAPARLAAA